MGRLLQHVVNQLQQGIGYNLRCPACAQRKWGVGIHYIPLTGKVCWQFNGNEDSPTFTPSVKETTHWEDEADPAKKKEFICHFNITNGQIVYSGDCTHSLKGQTIPMIPW